MNVAMLSYHTCPLATLGGKDTGGMNVYVRELTRQLGASGVHVDVFTRSQDEHVPHVLHDLGYGNRVVHIAAGPEVPMPKGELAGYLTEFVNGITQFAEQKGVKYDILHSHYWMSGIAALQLRNLWNTPIVHMFHTLGAMKNRVALPNEQIEGDYRIRGEKQVIAKVDRLIAPTLAELAQIQWLYHADTQKITIIPPGVDIGKFYPIPEDEAKAFIGVTPCQRMLLFVGRIEPLKGLDILLEAVALMKDKGLYERHPFCLAVIGGDPDVTPGQMSSEMARIQAISRQYNLEGFVTFLGKKSQDTLPYYYSAAEAVIVPSHYESFGMVALEAMACGTPVVASQVGGLAFLVQDGETGYQVPVGEPDALCDRLTAILENPELRARLGAQAAEFAKSYRWEYIVDQIQSVYRELLD